jgi:hypothetical protein
MSAQKKRGQRAPAETLGWREWAGLPELGVQWIKAKLDTGARTSALHAFELERFQRDGTAMVRFEVHPRQRSRGGAVRVEQPVVDERWVRNSGGQRELRPVIETTVAIGERSWPIELTLTRRDEMGFRMLLGRQALRRRVLVDSGRSYRAGRPPRTETEHERGRHPTEEQSR